MADCGQTIQQMADYRRPVSGATMARTDKALQIPVIGVLLALCLGEGQVDFPPQTVSPMPRERWFFGFGRNLAGAANGLNGMVLSSFSLESVLHWSER